MTSITKSGNSTMATSKATTVVKGSRRVTRNDIRHFQGQVNSRLTLLRGVQCGHFQRLHHEGQPRSTEEHRQRHAGAEVDLVDVVVLSSNVMASLWYHFPYVFRIGEHGGCGGPSLLREVCLERGWKEYEGEDVDECVEKGINLTSGHHWNFWWSLTNYGTRSLQSFSSWQLTNRMTRSFSYTSKDTCTRYLRRLRNAYGDIFDLCPLTFNVPSEYAKLCIEHTKRKSKAFWTFWDRAHYIGTPVQKPIDVESQPIWICKPVGKSQGKGISVFDTVTKLSYNRRSVVQEYITRPLLIGPYKWDLRIYVTIVCLQPLVFYAYREGLVRFATLPFDLKNLQNPFAHLTNSSVNKQSPAYYQNKTGVGRGCKWSLCKLRHHFREKGVRDWVLWQRIASILILTIIGDATLVSKVQEATRIKTFFLMGFDILVDRTLRPLLIEVNSNPSLSNDCEVDRIVKKRMLHDLFDLLNLPDGRLFHNYINSNPLIFINSPTHPVGSRRPSQDPYESSTEDESTTPISSESDSSRGQLSRTELEVIYSALEVSNGGQPIPPLIHIRGPTHAYKEILKLTNGFQRDVRKFGNTHEHTQASEIPEVNDPSHRMRFPMMVTIPVKRRQGKKSRSATTPWRPGLLLSTPEWYGNSPATQGNWVRIFPFNQATEKLTSGRNFDVKDVARQVQEFLKCVNQLDNLEGSEEILDQQLQEKVQLNTPPWHPPVTAKKPRF